MPGERHHHHHQKRHTGQPHFSPWENHAVSPLKAICRHIREKHTKQKKAIWNNKHEFTKDKKQLQQPDCLL